MNAKLRNIVATLAVLMGIAHTAYGLIVFDKFDLDVVWFLGAGIAMIVTGLANFRHDRMWVLQLQNFVMFAYGIMIAAFIQPPQVWITLALFGALLILSIVKRRA